MLIKTIRELKKRVVIIFCASSIVVFSQEKKLNVPSYILLPQDTIISNNLLKSLNGFLSQKEKPNNENTFILKEDMLATYALIDEMKEIEKSGKYKDDNFYKGYLTNIIATGTTDYLVQFSYIGVNENIPILRANFELIAKQKNNQFYFSSALQKNTSTWKTEKVGNFLITYKSVLNKIKIGKYINKVYEFDKKIGSNFITELYLCDNFFDSLKLLGVNYKLEYNSVISNSLSSRNDLKLLLINGELYSNPKLFDPHDLWHERLHNVLSTSIINKPVDEGCAYLYGGSWGISWAEIQNMFKLKVSYNTQTEFLPK